MRKSEDEDEDSNHNVELKNDEEFLHNKSVSVFSRIFITKLHINYFIIKSEENKKPNKYANLKESTALNKEQIDKARELRLKEIKMWGMLREFFVFTVFISMLYIVSYSNYNSNYYQYQKNIQNIFISSESSQDFKTVSL
jgi:hypothetical protein